MKKLLLLILLLPASVFADRLGSLRSNAQVLLSTQTPSLNGGPITTSSVTITGAGIKFADGTVQVTSAPASGGSASGSSGNVQYNSGGSFAGVSFSTVSGQNVGFSAKVSASSFSALGAGGASGQFVSLEGTSPTTLSGSDILFGNSILHNWMMLNNGGIAYQVVGTTATTTPAHLAVWSNQGALIDGGASGSAVTPGGSSGNMQYNNGGSFAGVSYSTVTGTSVGFTGLISASSFSATGSGAGQFVSTEGTAPSGVSSQDILYGDSTAHAFKVLNNNGTAAQVVISSITPTVGHVASWSGTGQVIDGRVNQITWGDGTVQVSSPAAGGGLSAVFHRQYYPIGSGAVGNTSGGSGNINFPASFSGAHQTTDAPPGQVYSWAALAASADTFVILTDAFPSNVTGNIAVKVFAQPSSATGNASVLMVISGCIGDNGGTFLNGALPVYNSSQTVTNTWNGTSNVRDITITSAMSTTGCTGGDRMLLKIGRQGTNGSDTYGSDVYIIGIKLEYSTTN